MVGERIREARQAQGRSLADVAAKLKISVATLSRIENEKQSVDLGLFLSLARALHVPPNEFLRDDAEAEDIDPLARRIASLAAKERTSLWRELAEDRRNQRARRIDPRQMAMQVEELLAQLEFLREELEAVSRRIKRRK
jgi:transcriptional regulator with XRE-family HTH domain